MFDPNELMKRKKSLQPPPTLEPGKQSASHLNSDNGGNVRTADLRAVVLQHSGARHAHPPFVAGAWVVYGWCTLCAGGFL